MQKGVQPSISKVCLMNQPMNVRDILYCHVFIQYVLLFVFGKLAKVMECHQRISDENYSIKQSGAVDLILTQRLHYHTFHF